MTLDEAIKHCEEVAEEQDKLCKRYDDASGYSRSHNEDIRTTGAIGCEVCAKEHRQLAEWLKDYKRLLEQEPCGMTAEEYRQRMIQAFHNADTDGLIAVCVLPTEKEFEHLEWLLKNHYKKEPCEDAISREAVIDMTGLSEWFDSSDSYDEFVIALSNLPPVIPQPKTGRWIDDKCSVCGKGTEDLIESSEWYRNKSPKYCPFCGIKIQPYKAESEG